MFAAALAQRSARSSSALSTTLLYPRTRVYGRSLASVHAAPRVAKQLSSETPTPRSQAGVARALEDTLDTRPTTTLFARDFSLKDRVVLVTGGNGRIALESSLAMVEAGARAVYCIDLPEHPTAEWTAVRDYAARIQDKAGEGRLEYISADVRNQKGIRVVGETIADKEGRLDVCLAAAGILSNPADCLELSEEAIQEVLDTNVKGALFTAQAAGLQMRRFGQGGSIILLASIAGYNAFRGHPLVQYHTSKAALPQMARSLACELGSEGIRVNSISPGFIRTNRFMQPYLDARPEFAEEWGQLNPLGRLGEARELRGAAVWLASDASSFCTGSDIMITGGHHAW
ncbi:hypothetical protein BD413DRAFT_189966 [Trametes elegans]|nr:hypothetical protein BD413DRAFT_189966 [Trametes elegans]